MTTIEQEPTIDNGHDIETKLSFITLHDNNLTMLLNGEIGYPVALPKLIHVKSKREDKTRIVENKIIEGCYMHSVNYVSQENVQRLTKEIVDLLYARRIQQIPQQQQTETEEESQEQQTTAAPVLVELTPELTKEITFEDVAEILSTSIKKDKAAKLITFCGNVLSQTNDDQLNIGFQAESSAGKSYIPIEVSNYFPKEEVEIIASASPTAFYHDKGVWDKSREVLIRSLKGKILVFLDQPHYQLLEKLRPLLSHDSRELAYKITDKNQKFGMRTKNVILVGYPTVNFCSTQLEADEQEKTRLILLSPTTDQEKLRESLELASLRKGNPEEYRKRIQSDPKRAWLVNRIYALRQWGIREINLPNDGKDVFDRFMSEHPYLLPRHQRDFPRIFSFIKASALLNCFNREKIKEDTILANESDIDAGFALYKEIEGSNELGLSPYIYRVYKEVIEPQLDKAIGLPKKQIRTKFYSIFHKPLHPKLEESIITQLESAGLIEQIPDSEDKRKLLLYPTVSEDIF